MRPDWFGPSTYNWVPQMGHHYDPWNQEAQSKVGQQWYRSPKWGGHVIYNPQYGFQDLRQVQDFYIGWDPSQTPNFSKAFQQAGFQKQLSDVGDWTRYYGDPEHAHVSHQQKLAMYGGGQPGQQQQYQWGQPQQTQQQYGGQRPSGRTQDSGGRTGFYAPQYGSTVSQLKAGGTAETPDTQMTSTPGRYYGKAKKRTSMRYGYKPSM